MNPLKSLFKSNEVEFFCEEEDYGVIPEPYPARKLIPDWYKALPPKLEKKDLLRNSTIKRCAPFLDAMTVGWIIPLAADVEIITNSDASGLDYKWIFHKTMIENHNPDQISTSKCPHHSAPKPPLKFLNYIYIKMPPGYSALFVPPLNRPDPRFTCISGLVDDGYMGTDDLSYINFPFFFNIPSYTGIIKAGTPLVQLIPIKRDHVLEQSRKIEFNKISKENKKKVEKTIRRRSSHESLYRDKHWVRK